MELPCLIPAAGCCIVLVDDNSDVADILAQLLRLYWPQVHVCYSGQQALEANQQLQPHIMLLDIGMPDMDGHQTGQLLRQQPGGQALILIALTGYYPDEIKLQTDQFCFDGYLVKPPDVGDLNTLMIRLLSEREMARPAAIG